MSGITKITIPQRIQVIPKNAFDSCVSLAKVEFKSKSNLVSIGEHAFSMTKLSMLCVPKPVRYVGAYAFYKCSALSSVELGENICDIGQSCF